MPVRRTVLATAGAHEPITHPYRPVMQQCAACDAEFADELAECPSCGAAPEAGPEYVCARCGEEYTGTDGCPVCGTLRQPVACERHPERMAEERCVVCGRPLCEECRAGDGRPALCFDHADVRVMDGWAQVYSATSDFEAQLLRDNLRAEGIEAQMFSQRDRAFSVDLGELSIVRLLVPVWEYEHALATIRAHMDTAGEVVFACPACGEAYDPGARECGACGAPLA